YFLTRWWAENEEVKGRTSERVKTLTRSPVHPFIPSQKWLYAFCLSAGLGITHHPLTVFGFPAYALFILGVWWGKEIGDWRLEIGNTRLNLQSLISNLRR